MCNSRIGTKSRGWAIRRMRADNRAIQSKSRHPTIMFLSTPLVPSVRLLPGLMSSGGVGQNTAQTGRTVTRPSLTT